MGLVRGKGTKGVKSRDMRAFTRLVEAIVKEQGYITPGDLLAANKPFLIPYFEFDKPLATLQKRKASNLIKSLYSDNRPAFVYDPETKKHRPFKEIYPDVSAYNTKYALRFLKSAMGFLEPKYRQGLQGLINELE